MKSVFERHIPPAAVEYCWQLYQGHQFRLWIKANRKTKLGDFRYDPLQRSYLITLNYNLPPALFLLTYLHEVAHLVVHRQYGNSVLPHGSEWKTSFRTLAMPVLNETVFEPQILQALQRYFINPAATFNSSSPLGRVIYPQKATEIEDGTVALAHLSPGVRFIFRQRQFEMLETRRTRVLCKELSNGKKYLIHQSARVRSSDV
jgi:SprT protein